MWGVGHMAWGMGCEEALGMGRETLCMGHKTRWVEREAKDMQIGT